MAVRSYKACAYRAQNVHEALHPDLYKDLSICIALESERPMTYGKHARCVRTWTNTGMVVGDSEFGPCLQNASDNSGNYLGTTTGYGLPGWGGSPFSISLWAASDDNAENGGFAQRGATPLDNGWRMQFIDDPAATLFLILGDSGGNNHLRYETGTSAVTEGEMFHFVVTYDGGTTNAGLRGYVNGVYHANTRSDGGGTYEPPATPDGYFDVTWSDDLPNNWSHPTRHKETSLFDAELNENQVRKLWEIGPLGILEPLPALAGVIEQAAPSGRIMSSLVGPGGLAGPGGIAGKGGGLAG